VSTGAGDVTVPPIVVMGVSGCGKSTVGTVLARRLGVPFLEGDDVHPAENVAKMASGEPLNDDDRRPWLDRIGEWLADPDRKNGGVAACSALARRYRDQLREHAPETWFLHLSIGREEMLRRVAGRRGHFMPATLVDSQLAALEPLQDDEAGLTVSALSGVGRIVGTAIGTLDGR
jgi:gluconokinase